MKKKLLIAGKGAWGQALAFVMQCKGHQTAFWSRDQQVPTQLTADYDGLILAVPAQACREVLQILMPCLGTGIPIFIAAKGIEAETGLLLHQVIHQIAPDNPCLILSGPGFARDVLDAQPIALSLAGPTCDLARIWAQSFSLTCFRLYPSEDRTGVALGGALKNILAIACGIAEGRKLGESARAGLITRGFAELRRFGTMMGAQPITLMGLSGLGDLILTCSSHQSRNYAFGIAIGQGSSVAEAKRHASGVIEGALSLTVAYKMAQAHQIVAPIISAVYDIVEKNHDPSAVITSLLVRPTPDENERIS